MLRSQIIAAVDHLHAVLIETGVQSTIRGAFDVGRRDKKDHDAVLSTFAKFYSEYLRLNEYEHEVLRIFDLQALGSSEFWKLLLAEDVHIPPVSNIYQGLFYLDKYVPRIINLLRRRTDVAGDAVDIEPVPGAMETIITAKKTLTVIVPESDDRLSSPERLIMLFRAIQNLYEALAILEGEPTADLAIAGCDSGSDKVFDFTGISRIIEKIQSVLIECWERTVYFRERQFNERLKLVSESIPILGNIADLERSGKISPEQAEQLRRKITSGVSLFLETGSRTPEMAETGRLDPAVLLQPRETLLLAPPQSAAASDRKPSRRQSPKRRRLRRSASRRPQGPI